MWKLLIPLLLSGNRLKELTESVCDLPCLRLLDISNNEVTELPRRLACVRTLETLQLDADKFKYPQSSKCDTELVNVFQQ